MQAIVEELSRHAETIHQLLAETPEQIRAALKLQEGHTRHTLQDVKKYQALKEHMNFKEISQEAP